MCLKELKENVQKKKKKKGTTDIHMLPIGDKFVYRYGALSVRLVDVSLQASFWWMLCPPCGLDALCARFHAHRHVAKLLTCGNYAPSCWITWRYW